MNKLILLLILFPIMLCAQECHTIFGVSETPYKPYSWVDPDRKAHGMNIELFEALSKEAGCSYEIKTMNWAQLVEHFDNGSVDVIASSLSPFADSKKGLDVMQIPFNIAFYGHFYTRNDSAYIKDLSSLNGKTVLILQDSVTHDYMRNLSSEYNIRLLPYPTTESAIDALASGVGDVGIFSLTAAINVLDNREYTHIRVSGKPVFPASYGFIMKKAELYDMLNEAMDRLKAKGTYFDIVKEWHNSQNRSLIWLKYVAIAVGLILVIFFGVMLWNKTLYEQVQKKTSALNQEIEQRKQAEQDNIKLRDEATISEKLAVLGEMSTSIVHEINNPTGLIIHNVDFLMKVQRELRALTPYVPNNFKICGMNWESVMFEAEDALGLIDESLAHITNTINDLKEYGREHASVMQPIDLQECLNLSVKLTRYFIKKYTTDFRVDIAPGNYIIHGNMLHIQQIIINLIHNACYALTDKRQVITCSLTSEIVDNMTYGKITVTDEGRGMSDEVMEALFTPFFTTRRESGGTGLGLSIISRIVKEYNGLIEIKSEEGEGTVVSVMLPLSGEEQ